MACAFAVALGAFLLAEGIWGLSSQRVFGTLTTNLLHATIQIALGAAGCVLGLRRRAEAYLVFVGSLLLAVGLLSFVPGANALLVTLLNVNVAVAVLDVVLGLAALVVRRS